jgi:tRNA-specific 2-thiouridylase
MSGGVDSAVTAALLLERGHRVRGVTARFWREGGEADQDMASARAVCRRLGIDHEVVDLADEFYRAVVQHFVAEYAAGRTPNPCIACNRELKFGLLLDRVVARGERLATGHYARIVAAAEGLRLHAGVDAAKDQSYFLYMLGQTHLSRILLPLGEWRKSAVIEQARALGLPAAERAESQDVCFIADGDYRRFIREHAPGLLRPGPIEDRSGRVLGEHGGLALYTVGQREGLGIAVGEPLYVLRLDAPRNALVVGPADALGQRALLADEMVYVAGAAPAAGMALQAKIRYRARQVACALFDLGEQTARIEFAAPLRDITPGQAVVVYNGTEVIGGGAIRCALDD